MSKKAVTPPLSEGQALVERICSQLAFDPQGLLWMRGRIAGLSAHLIHAAMGCIRVEVDARILELGEPLDVNTAYRQMAWVCGTVSPGELAAVGELLREENSAYADQVIQELVPGLGTLVVHVLHNLGVRPYREALVNRLVREYPPFIGPAGNGGIDLTPVHSSIDSCLLSLAGNGDVPPYDAVLQMVGDVAELHLDHVEQMRGKPTDAEDYRRLISVLAVLLLRRFEYRMPVRSTRVPAGVR